MAALTITFAAAWASVYAGLSRRERGPARHRVVFVKVAESKTRGWSTSTRSSVWTASEGPASPPPTWATLVNHWRPAIRAARAATVSVTTPIIGRRRGPTLRRGAAKSTSVALPAAGDSKAVDHGGGPVRGQVATKAAEAAGLTSRPCFCPACDGDAALNVEVATRRCARTCAGYRAATRMPTSARLSPGTAWAPVQTRRHLGWLFQNAPRPLRVRRWAHQPGYRGHFTTKSRTYSTTFAALRAERRHGYRCNQLLDRLGVADDTGGHCPATGATSGRATRGGTAMSPDLLTVADVRPACRSVGTPSTT